MPIFTQGPRQRHSLFLEDFEAPLSDVLGGVSEDAWLRSASPSIIRYRELEDAAGRSRPVTRSRELAEPMATPELPDRLSKEDAQEYLKRYDMSLPIPEEGVTREWLDMQIGNKRRELRIADLHNRSPEGFWPGVLKIGTALGTAMLDPLNITTAFIPILGPARYTAALKGASGLAGRAAVRTKFGVVEGAFGAAILEPIVYGQARKEFAEYDFVDSLMAVGFGTVLGGGLHVGAGAISDAIAKGLNPRLVTKPAADGPAPIPKMLQEWSPKERREGLQVALSQILNGKHVDLDPYTALRNELGEVRPKTMDAARRQAAQELAPQLREQLAPLAGKRLTATEVKQLKKELKLVDATPEDLTAANKALDAEYTKRANRIQRDEKVSRRAAENRARKEIAQEKEKLKQTRNDLQKDKVAARKRIEDQLAAHEEGVAAGVELHALERGEVPESARDTVRTRARELMTQDRFAQNKVSAAVRASIGQKWDDVVRQARTQDQVPGRLHEPETVRAMDEQLKEAPKTEDSAAVQAEIADVMIEAQELGEATGVRLDKTFEAYDARIAEVNTYEKAMRAAVSCQFRS